MKNLCTLLAILQLAVIKSIHHRQQLTESEKKPALIFEVTLPTVRYATALHDT